MSSAEPLSEAQLAAIEAEILDKCSMAPEQTINMAQLMEQHPMQCGRYLMCVLNLATQGKVRIQQMKPAHPHCLQDIKITLLN